MRVNAVRALLENTDKLLSGIAAETGFFDQSHLTRIFKKERGVTPGLCRRRHNYLHDEEAMARLYIFSGFMC